MKRSSEEEARLDEASLRRMIETFENELGRLCERSLAPDDRAAVSALRDSWAKLVELGFLPMERVRPCPSCKRSLVQPGPRCTFCWHKLSAVEALVENGERRVLRAV